MDNKITIGFLSNQLTLRGTEVAMWDYAYYNEEYLGNESIIITRDISKIDNPGRDLCQEAYDKFRDRFPVFYYENTDDIDNIVATNNITHLYIIKSGTWDGLVTINCKNLIHCVFAPIEQHGEVYSVIGDNINRRFNTNYPVVPHMISLPNHNHDLRKTLGIPENSLVFGRYGGKDTFDISFVYNVIDNIVNTCDNVYFLFMNTDPFLIHDRIIYLNGTTNQYIKKAFINSCDALLHARLRGETFGLTCGEFAISDKPVITFKNSPEREHINILGEKAILYENSNDLYDILVNFDKSKYDMTENGYKNYTPQRVMDIFKKVYLDG